MSELKACPFCGGEASIRSEYDSDGYGYFHWVECKKCRSRSASHFASQGNECPIYYQGVRSDWNNRQHENKLKADAILEYEASLSSFPYTAEEYIKAFIEGGVK